jgi:polysaccharide biosynthesis transport protein
VELRDYVEILRRRWVSVVIVALAGLALGAVISLVMTPAYTATTRLFFAVEGSESVSDLAQGSTFAEKQMSSYAEVATSPLTLEPVTRKIQLSTDAATLAKSISAHVPPETVILEISATDPDPTLAAAIANAVGSEVSDVAAQLSPERADGSRAVQATTLAPALVPTKPSSPHVLRNLALGLVLGTLLGIGVALLRHVLDTKVRTENDIRAVTEAPILGSIAFDERVPSHPVIVRDDPLSAPAEAVRRLRTNLQFVNTTEHAQVIVISSSVPQEGKTTTTINLAVALAEAGARVIVVDADLRRPSIATYLGLEGGVGLTTVLIGRADLDDVLQPWQSSRLDVLPSGQIPPNPSELLGSPSMQKLLADLAERYDVVLLDSAPLLPVTDAAVLTKMAGGALLVAGADRIHRPQLEQAIDSLRTAGAHLHGIVLNKISRQDGNAYRYGYGYGGAQQNTPIDRRTSDEPEPQLTSR